jgi:hypothetical protein
MAAISYDKKNKLCAYYNKEYDETKCTHENSKDVDFYTIPNVTPIHEDFTTIIDDKLQFDNEHRKAAFDIYNYCSSIGHVFNKEIFEQCLNESKVKKLR